MKGGDIANLDRHAAFSGSRWRPVS